MLLHTAVPNNAADYYHVTYFIDAVFRNFQKTLTDKTYCDEDRSPS